MTKFCWFQKGQLKEYLLGKALRKRYDTYLGHYTPPAVEARSTNYNRTKASLELVLAGLYPPSETEIFYGKLRWQPIPFQYGASKNDWVKFEIHKWCRLLTVIVAFRFSCRPLRSLRWEVLRTFKVAHVSKGTRQTQVTVGISHREDWQKF